MLFQKEVDFLRHLVSAEGIKQNPHNIEKSKTLACAKKCNGSHSKLRLRKLLKTVCQTFPQTR